MKGKKYTVMLCDQFESVNAIDEKDAERIVMEKIKSGEIELAMIIWCDDVPTKEEKK